MNRTCPFGQRSFCVGGLLSLPPREPKGKSPFYGVGRYGSVGLKHTPPARFSQDFQVLQKSSSHMDRILQSSEVHSFYYDLALVQLSST